MSSSSIRTTSGELSDDLTSAQGVPLATESVFSHLPIELVRSIIVAVAEENHYLAFQLCLVSRAVYLWIHPIAYRTIVVGDFTASTGDREPAERFNQCLDDTVVLNWRTPLRANGPVDVRNIHFYPTGDDPENYEPIYFNILKKCPRVERLILPLEANEHAEDETWPKPWEIIILMFHGDDWITPDIHPIMLNVTHLYLTVGFETEDDTASEDLLSACLALPNLTHFAREFDKSCMILPVSFLPAKPSLQMLFIFVEPGSECPIPLATFAVLRQIRDPRLFVGSAFSENDQHHFLENDENLWDLVPEKYSTWRTVTRTSSDLVVLVDA
ncbi:hypothetical protein BU17DRAFT_96879 [Hysterangium stoloniferum]|nr:hypothetical protein BU17DRAFT_96879 [Hysterangium stoloniferum]